MVYIERNIPVFVAITPPPPNNRIHEQQFSIMEDISNNIDLEEYKYKISRRRSNQSDLDDDVTDIGSTRDLEEIQDVIVDQKLKNFHNQNRYRN